MPLDVVGVPVSPVPAHGSYSRIHVSRLLYYQRIIYSKTNKKTNSNYYELNNHLIITFDKTVYHKVLTILTTTFAEAIPVICYM